MCFVFYIEEEVDGEAFVLMSVDDIVSMVSTKGAQLKLAEKKRQLSSSQPAVTADSYIVSTSLPYNWLTVITESSGPSTQLHRKLPCVKCSVLINFVRYLLAFQ